MTGTNDGPLPSPEGELPPTGESIAVPAAVFAEIDEDGRARGGVDAPAKNTIR